jgi:hypothetical protein
MHLFGDVVHKIDDVMRPVPALRENVAIFCKNTPYRYIFNDFLKPAGPSLRIK